MAVATMWRGLVENYSERTLWTAGAPLHTLAFVAANVGLHLMHRHQILARYKIQPLKYPTDQLMRKGLVVRLSYLLSLEIVVPSSSNSRDFVLHSISGSICASWGGGEGIDC
jgi:hypothetical protein